MAIFQTPPKSPEILRRLGELDELRRYLADHLGDSAQPWTGALRRLARHFSRAQGGGVHFPNSLNIARGRENSCERHGGKYRFQPGHVWPPGSASNGRKRQRPLRK